MPYYAQIFVWLILRIYIKKHFNIHLKTWSVVAKAWSKAWTDNVGGFDINIFLWWAPRGGHCSSAQVSYNGACKITV